jgi:FkbM family methyltransferase
LNRAQIYNILYNRLDEIENITCELLALSDKNYTTSLYLNASHAENTLSFDSKNVGFPVQPVYCLKLDTYLYFINKPKIVILIKIDVEGHEYSVLIGAHNLLSEHKPIVLCEFEERHQSSKVNLNQVITYLKKLSYNFYYYNSQSEKLLPVSGLVLHQNENNNYIFNYWFNHKSKTHLYT